MRFSDGSYQIEAADTCPEALSTTLAGEREHISQAREKEAFLK